MSSATTIARRVRVSFSRSFIVLATVVISFLGVEALVRTFYTEDQSQTWSAFHTTRGWALEPGDYWYKPPREMNRIGIHINDLGFRSPDFSANPEKKRLVILGDSFVFARESASEETFTERLKNLLGQNISGGVDVMNAGVPAYGTAQELLLVRELATERQIKPEMYLLMFFTNDPLDNLCLSYGDLVPEPIRPCFSLGKEGELLLANLPQNLPDYYSDSIVAAKPATSRRLQDFKIVSLGRAWAEEWMQTQPGLVQILASLGLSPRVGRMPGLLNAWYRQKVLSAGLPLTSALIEQMDREVRGNGGRLVVSMVPSTFQVYPETYIPLLRESFPDTPAVTLFESDISRPQRLVREICEKAGIPFQDLLPTFVEHRGKALFIPRDGHLTRVGHELASKTLLPFVLSHLPGEESANDLSQASPVSQ